MAGERNGVEPLAAGFEHEIPRCECAGAGGKRMHVEVNREHAISGEEERRLSPRAVGKGSGGEPDEENGGGSEACALHKPSRDATTCQPANPRKQARPRLQTMARSIARSRTASAGLRREMDRKKP